MNEDNIAVTGIVGSDPRTYVTAKGVPIVSFRLASSRRVFDRERGEWHDGETNWYTVSAFRRLADHVGFSVRKGEHVVVTGRLRIRAWQTADRQGTTAEIDAEAIGHDLNWAMTRPRRIQPGAPDGEPKPIAVESGRSARDTAFDPSDHEAEADPLEAGELDEVPEGTFDEAFRALAGPTA
ncbi:single-stranded DNA-binding protein [Agromyces mediolanus]|uniref:single-stranded DNA-binding protein n=1 Tax=Agromyces mediolanus TaxID=41986 RepID=UPI0020420D93|nr:single-stranded DNA-binding protein [Agromyces mediolanus]MCM3657102.1 single-stranded DNA-binding protein [Agromyces mediolanus]